MTLNSRIWPEVSFGEIFDISSSKRVLQSQWKPQGVPFYRAREIVKLARDGTVNNELFITEELYVELAKKFGVPVAGDLMISAVGTLGACYQVQPHDRFYFKDASVLRFHPKAELCSRFFWHTLQTHSLKQQIHSGSGSTVGTLTISRANELRTLLPPLDEQKRIAAILDKADQIRQKRRQAIALLDSLTQSIFLEMFGDPVSNPKGWPVHELSEFEQFLTSGSRGWAEFYADEGRPFIRIQNLKNGKLSTDDLVYVNAPVNAEARRTTVSAGDVLISITADLGRIAVVPLALDGDANINQHIALFRPKQINSFYLATFLASDGGKMQFSALNRQGVKAGLNFSDIRRLRILVPPVTLQAKFEQLLISLEARKDSYLSARIDSESLFASLQHRAFSGQL